jgi:hypothetical protein
MATRTSRVSHLYFILYLCGIVKVGGFGCVAWARKASVVMFGRVEVGGCGCVYGTVEAGGCCSVWQGLRHESVVVCGRAEVRG